MAAPATTAAANPAAPPTVAVRDGRVVAVGALGDATAAQRVDATGFAVAPGFFNILSWAPTALLHDGRGVSDIKQGVTLEVFGEGWSEGPLNEAMRAESLRQKGDTKYDITWTTLAGFLDHLVAQGVSPNVASIVGATTVRFKGTEALGNGVTAVFNLEYALGPDTNTGIASARQTYVGLTGDFGTVVAGRLQPMAKAVSDKYDTMASMWFSPVNSLDKAAGTTINNGIRLSNAGAYVSPTMAGGLTAQLAYSFAGASELDGTAYSGDAERILGFGLDYNNGPVGLSLIYHRSNDLGNVVGADARDMLVGGSYDFGAAKVVASWQSVKRES